VKKFSYLDFDLSIEGQPGAYQARVIDSPTGQAVHNFDLPFSSLELENFYLRLGRPRRGVRRVDSPEMAFAKDFGERMFKSVVDEQVQTCFLSSLAFAQSQGKGLRLRLRLNAPELNDLPWEYLHSPDFNRFLSLSVDTPIVRYLEVAQPPRVYTVSPPLHTLVVIASPSQYPPLDTEQEWQRLSTALFPLESRGLLKADRLDVATLTNLQQMLRRSEYHIIHFVGHGAFDDAQHDGMLVFEDENNLGVKVSGAYLGTLLHDHKSLQLVILNACEGARTSASDPFAGVAQSLVQQGVPAVIAMQFPITDEAAITFSQEFYKALADRYPVDAALSEVRKAIFAQGNDVEWGTPVLFTSVPDGQIFDFSQALPPTGTFEPVVPKPVPPLPKDKPPPVRTATPGIAPPKKLTIPPWAIGLGGGIGLLFIIALCVGSWNLLGNFGFLPERQSTATITPSVAEQQAGATAPLKVITAPVEPTRTPEPSATNSLDPTFEALFSSTPTPVDTAIPVVFIPDASFRMGGDPNQALKVCAEIGEQCGYDWFADEEPIHPVSLSSFYIDQYEVTNSQYDVCVKLGFCSPPEYVNSASRSDYYTNPLYANYPVVYIDWLEAQEYCNWRGGRLPTEAEWEYAARGGLKQSSYPWGNDLPVCQDGASNGARFYTPGCEYADSAPVGSYAPNGLHLFDMAGNVMEWVGDWYNEFYYASLIPGQLDPPGPLSGTLRVARGGAWDSPAYLLRVSMRYGADPNAGAPNLGFRCVLSP
jgi:formylglycine-generating enzyme required for sulfatase activity